MAQRMDTIKSTLHIVNEEKQNISNSHFSEASEEGLVKSRAGSPLRKNEAKMITETADVQLKLRKKICSDTRLIELSQAAVEEARNTSIAVSITTTKKDSSSTVHMPSGSLPSPEPETKKSGKMIITIFSGFHRQKKHTEDMPLANFSKEDPTSILEDHVLVRDEEQPAVPL